MWLDDDIPLELHHIDNNHHNNNLSNLQLLCSNCHSYIHKKQAKIKQITLPSTQKHTRKSKLKPEKRKVVRPSYEVLIQQVSELGYVKTGKLYNVSDNAIRKWIKMYQKHT